MDAPLAAAPSDPLAHFKLVPIAKQNQLGEKSETFPLSPVLPSIFLFDKEAVTLGRCRITQIRDLSLSRKQVRVEAKYDVDFVEVTQLGKGQASSINGLPLVYPWSRMLNPGDTLCLNGTQHEYKLERVDKEASENVPVKVLCRKRHMTETFDTATDSSTPAGAGAAKRRRSQRLTATWTPQQLVDQLDALSAEKVSRRRTISTGISDNITSSSTADDQVPYP